MPIHHSLPAALAFLALAITATAEPPSAPSPEPPAEAKIEHLEVAAKHLAEAGMTDESTRLRVKAAALRRHRHQGELEAMIEALRAENQTLLQRLEDLEAHTDAPDPKAPADLDQLAAEAHRKQTADTWAQIKRTARGPRPLPPAPADQDHNPATPPLEAEEPAAPAPPDEHALLLDILRTLQRIERGMNR